MNLITIDSADAYFQEERWDSADYLNLDFITAKVNKTSGSLIGDSEIPIDELSEKPYTNMYLKFDNHDQTYQVVKGTNSTILKITPALVSDVPDDTNIEIYQDKTRILNTGENQIVDNFPFKEDVDLSSIDTVDPKIQKMIYEQSLYLLQNPDLFDRIALIHQGVTYKAVKDRKESYKKEKTPNIIFAPNVLELGSSFKKKGVRIITHEIPSAGY